MILLHSPGVEINESVSTVSGPVSDDLTADTRVDPLAYSSTAETVHPHPLLPDSQFVKNWSEFVLVEVRQEQRRPFVASKHQTTRAIAKVLIVLLCASFAQTTNKNEKENSVVTAPVVDSRSSIEEMEREDCKLGSVAAAREAASSELNSSDGIPLDKLTQDQVCTIANEGEFATLHARSKEIGTQVMKFIWYFERYKPIVVAMKAKFAPRRGSHARMEVEPGIEVTWAEYCARYYGVGYRWVEKQINGDYLSVPNEDAADAAHSANEQTDVDDPHTTIETQPSKKDKIIAQLQHKVDDLTAKLASAVSPAPPQPPPISGDPVPQPEPGTLEALRQTVYRTADTEEIKEALEKFLADLVTPLLEHHPYKPVHTVSVRVKRLEKRRAVVGDWVEYTGSGEKRLREQIGNDQPSLGRVVGEDQLGRPRIRWYNGAQWLKPYSLFYDPTPEFGFRVLYDWQAVERYAEGFHAYPPDKESKTFTPTPPVPVKASVASKDAANDEAVPKAANEPEGASLVSKSSPFVIISSGSEKTEESVETAAIKGCSYIYAPRGQAGEYAPLACNPYRGCGHKCAYCYVPHVLKMKREEFDAGAVPRPEFLRNLEKGAAKYQEAGYHGQVMLSCSTDPYHPGDTSQTRQTVECLQLHGMGFCTLTKGGTRALRDIDLFRPDRDAFASTLTSLDDAFSLKWERDAALPGDRIAALKAFHDRGIFTWVSLEPTLDCESSLEIVEHTHRYVDLYKIGLVNYLLMTKTTNWKDYTERMMQLCAKLKVAHYFKKDLQQFLPAGSVNMRRHKQHHSDQEFAGNRKEA